MTRAARSEGGVSSPKVAAAKVRWLLDSENPNYDDIIIIILLPCGATCLPSRAKGPGAALTRSPGSSANSESVPGNLAAELGTAALVPCAIGLVYVILLPHAQDPSPVPCHPRPDHGASGSPQQARSLAAWHEHENLIVHRILVVVMRRTSTLCSTITLISVPQV